MVTPMMTYYGVLSPDFLETILPFDATLAALLFCSASASPNHSHRPY